MELYLIRHGESIGNTKKGFISGQSDPDGLTQKGRAQIIRTAWELKDEQFDALYYSPVQRAKESAELINTYFKLPLTTQPWLTELDQGIFETHYWWEVIDKIPAGWSHKPEEYENAFPNGESMKMLIHRVADGYEQFSENLKSKSKVALVSHNATITALVYFLQHGHPRIWTTPEEIKAFITFMHETKPGNAAIFKVKIEEG